METAIKITGWRAALVMAIAGAAFGSGQAGAQDYPTGPVEFIVPFGAGGGGDTSQRMFNKHAEPVVGQTLPVTNKPGAGGVIGWTEALQATPDGYTLMAVTAPQNVLPVILSPSQTGYTNDQFTYLCVYAALPDVILVPEDSQFQTLADLVDYAKANPGTVTVANTGTLGGDYMVTVMVEDAAGIEMTKVPFNSGAEGNQATLSGTTNAQVASALHAVAQKGAMRTLGIASAERSALVPDVPTFREQGYDVISERYRVIAGPPGLPEEIVSYWGDVCDQVTHDEAFLADMNEIGAPVEFKGPEETTKAIGDMTAAMQRLAERYNLVQ
jgi:tripartite-type tricarboxylate transporter receptor subunit TctC